MKYSLGRIFQSLIHLSIMLAVIISTVVALPVENVAVALSPTCVRQDDGVIVDETKDGTSQTVWIQLWDLPGLAGITQQYLAAYQHTFLNHGGIIYNQAFFNFPEIMSASLHRYLGRLFAPNLVFAYEDSKNKSFSVCDSFSVSGDADDETSCKSLTDPEEVLSCPETPVATSGDTNNVSTYRSARTYKNLLNEPITISYTRMSNWCQEPLGQAESLVDGGSCGIVCWKNYLAGGDPPTENETVTLGPGESSKIEISRTSPDGAACGSFQLDWKINKVTTADGTVIFDLNDITNTSALTGKRKTCAEDYNNKTGGSTIVGWGMCQTNITCAEPLDCQLWGSPQTIVRGQSTTLNWRSNFATEAYGPIPSPDRKLEEVARSGSVNVSPSVSTVYEMKFYDWKSEQWATCESLVTVTDPPAPATCSATVTPATIEKGSTSSPVLNCSSTGDAVVYKVTRPSNTPSGAPMVDAVPPNLLYNLAIPANLLDVGTYPVSCTPCKDAAMTDCAPITEDCSHMLTVTANACDLGKITIPPTVVNFKIAGSTYDPLTITWTQVAETPTPRTASYRVQIFRGSDTTAPLYNKTFARDDVFDDVIKNYSVTLSDVETMGLHNTLKSASEDKLLIWITPIGGATCPTDTGELKKGKDNPSTTTQVTVKARDGNCSGDEDPSIPGNLSAAGEATESPPYDLLVNTPTGSTLTSVFTFTSDLYSCNQGCTSDLSTATQKKCSKSGYSDTTLETILYVSKLNITGWWETIGGLAYGKNGVGATLPFDAGTCLETHPDFRKCAPFLMRSPDFEDTIRGGLALTANFASNLRAWASERTPIQFAEGLSTDDKGNVAALQKKENFAYNYYLSLIPAEKQTTLSLATDSLPTLPTLDSGKLAFVRTGNVKIDPAATLNVPAGQKYIFFITGDLTIDDTAALEQVITVDPGGFLAFFVKGKVTIKSNVGTALDTVNAPTPAIGMGVDPSLRPAQVEGIFVADEPIIIESNKSPIDPDKRFIGEGSFVSATNIDMQRSYNRLAGPPFSLILSGFTPTEVFRHRPDMVLATPIELKRGITQYQEVR